MAATTYTNEETWAHVQPGSWFEIAVESGDECTANATIHVDGQLAGSIADGALRPGPAPVHLVKPKGRYRVTVRLFFVQAGAATVTARLCRPSGSVHPKQFVWPVEGAPDELHRVAALVALLD